METQLFNSLPGLTQDELRELRDRALVLLAVGPKNEKKMMVGSNQYDFARDLYEATASILFSRTQVKGMPYHVFLKTPQYRDQYLPAVIIAADVNAQWFPKQTRVERLSMVRLYAKLVIDYLISQGRPLLWYNLNAAFSSLPAVVDSAFPGYAASGLLHKIQIMRTKQK